MREAETCGASWQKVGVTELQSGRGLNDMVTQYPGFGDVLGVLWKGRGLELESGVEGCLDMCWGDLGRERTSARKWGVRYVREGTLGGEWTCARRRWGEQICEGDALGRERICALCSIPCKFPSTIILSRQLNQSGIPPLQLLLLYVYMGL